MMNKTYIAFAIPLLLLALVGFAFAEEGSIESDFDNDDSIMFEDNANIESDPFGAEVSSTVSVETALDSNDLDDDEVDAFLRTQSSTRTHTISHGQGYLITSAGKISLVNGFWNVISTEEITKGRGQLKVGGVTFLLKATKSSETEKSFDLYLRDTRVGTLVFTRTHADRTNAVWEAQARIEIEDNAVTAEGMFVTVTRTVQTPVRNAGNDRETTSDDEATDNFDVELEDIEDNSGKKADRSWWQFWKRVEIKVDRSGSNSGSE